MRLLSSPVLPLTTNHSCLSPCFHPLFGSSVSISYNFIMLFLTFITCSFSNWKSCKVCLYQINFDCSRNLFYIWSSACAHTRTNRQWNKYFIEAMFIVIVCDTFAILNCYISFLKKHWPWPPSLFYCLIEPTYWNAHTHTHTQRFRTPGDQDRLLE